MSAFDGATWTAVGDSLSTEAFCVAERGTTVFAGHTAGISQIDGNAQVWSNVGTGLNGPVRAISLVGQNLYAGGSFTRSGDQPMPYLARWDGSTWSPVGGPLNGDVYTLATDGGLLYVGGAFNRAGDLPVRSIAIWDGRAWSAPSIDLLDSVQRVLSLLTTPDGALYAGGDLRPYGVPYPLFVAKWDGSRWTPLGSGVDSTVTALGLSGADLYLGGDFGNAGGRPSAHFARWRISDSLLVPSISVPTIASSGALLDYTVQVQNPGDDLHGECVFRAKVPDGTTFVGGSNGASVSANLIILPLGDIAAQSTVSATFTLQVQATNSFLVLDTYNVSDRFGRSYRGKAAFTSVMKNQKQPQTIVFPPPPAGVVGKSILLQPASSSGLPVNLEIIAGTATLIGNVLIPNDQGSIAIRASQEGNDFFYPAADLEQTFAIYPRPQVGILTSAKQISLNWPQQYSDFTLESAPSILGPWQRVPTETVGDQVTATLNPDGPRTFFRLTSPP